MIPSKIRFKIVTILVGLAVGLLLGEVMLRIIQPHNYFSVLLPNKDGTEKPPVHFFPGLDTLVHSTSNKYGYRSAHYFSKNKYGILTIGGSTTECVLLDDEKTWPFLLEKKLNSLSVNQFVVGNIGRASMNSGHHHLQLKYTEPQYDGIGLVLVLMGVNDYLRFLTSHPEYTPTQQSTSLFKEAFLRYPTDKNTEWYKRTELWMHLRNGKQAISSIQRASEFKRNLIPDMEDRIHYCRSIEKKDTLPNLSIALADYEKNIRNMAEVARQRNYQLIFISQPTLWKATMDSLSFNFAYSTLSFTKPNVYTPEAYAKGMATFNQKLKEVATMEAVPVIDLAELLPKDTTVFFDFCHFNNSGAEQVSDILLDRLQTEIKDDLVLTN